MGFKLVNLSELNQNDLEKNLKIIENEICSNNIIINTFDNLRKYIYIKDDISLLLNIDDKPAGILLGSIRGENAYIPAMIVMKNFRNLGYGRVILQKGLSLFAEKKATNVKLEVLQENFNAINLYKSEGFIIDNEILNYQNNNNSFFTKKSFEYLIEKSDGFTFQMIYRTFHKTKRPWIKEFRSLIPIIDSKQGELFLFKKNQKIIGYVILIRNNNILKIFDIFITKENLIFLNEIISSLLDKEKIVQINSIYPDEPIKEFIEKGNFYIKIKQYEMSKKLII